jgi:hypothetical protein
MKNGGHHLSLGLSQELWNDLLSAALPIELSQGAFELTEQLRAAARQLQVKERVAGLLEDRSPDDPLVRVRDRARAVWRVRRESVYQRVNEVIRVEGTWRVSIDDLGTQFRYGRQRVSADAFVKGVAEGRLLLLRENVEIPFTIEKRLGVSVTLGDIHYDAGREAVIGSLGDLGLHVGDGVVFQLLGRLGEYLLEQQLPRVNPVPILKREQVDEMVGGMGGALKMKMGVSDLELIVDEDELALRVRFGFSQLQLTDRRAGAD